ncbi:dTDP-4-dehydrorhamnose reductase [Marinilabilia sp.]|uniref:dTDP-4-dehydrorhamnose reductase n=1 Tax=Marinilabilia sp. TaxID=2021252 RepID=UPI0025B83F90|nr:dTDP-4-dehydrorhamnose reductase [Marinilabilia sp.]
MNKILIIGREGQLGSTFHEQTRELSWADFSYTTVDTLNLMDSSAICSFFKDKKFDYLINCAAYTAVDRAETEPAVAWRLNAEAPKELAEEATRMNARFIHISTDYVFGGEHSRPLKPETPQTPDSVYGKSKLQGELEVMQQQPESIIIRTSWLYSRYGKNFLKTMLQLGKKRDSLNVVFDQVGTPTLADDLAEAILTILKKIISGEKEFTPGVFHFSNEGVCSWFDFSKAIFYESGISCKVVPVESDQFPTPASRPAYSVMDKTKIRNTYGIEIEHWQDSLRKCLKKTNG